MLYSPKHDRIAQQPWLLLFRVWLAVCIHSIYSIVAYRKSFAAGASFDFYHILHRGGPCHHLRCKLFWRSSCDETPQLGKLFIILSFIEVIEVKQPNLADLCRLRARINSVNFVRIVKGTCTLLVLHDDRGSPCHHFTPNFLGPINGLAARGLADSRREKRT